MTCAIIGYLLEAPFELKEWKWIKNMIYITGDTHGEFHRFAYLCEGIKEIADNNCDYVIVCGDFGLCWVRDESFDYQCGFFEKIPFTTLWVQGNHENYDMIREFPIEKWNGGKVRHIVRDKVILLERGQVFEIEGNTFFTFGGASSHDVQGGILSRSDINFEWERIKAINSERPFRIVGESWWREELPSRNEMEEGIANLKKVGNRVDYIISHCISTSMQCKLTQSDKGKFVPDVLTDYFEEIQSKVQYKHWYFGHYHDDKKIDEKHTVLYYSIIPLYINHEKIREPIIGHPAYLQNEKVIFEVNGERKEGKIINVDAYGTMVQQEQPSYDVLVEEGNCLFKHIEEAVVRKVFTNVI